MITFVEYVNRKAIDKKKLDKVGDCCIYTVNSSAVREQNGEGFNRFGTHLEFKFIPNNEIWISKDISKHERQFLIDNGVNQYMAKKLGKKSWSDYALKKEKAEREKIDKLKFNPHTHSQKPSQSIYYKYYCGIPTENDDVEVWLVDGDKVRDLFKTDFNEGGNGEVYKWIPRQEIWIEKTLKEDEKNITVLHEYIERTLMKHKKMNYDKAHIIALKLDWQYLKKWKMEDVKALNREEALQMAKKYLP